MTEAVTGVLYLQVKDAKNCQRPPEARERQGSLLLPEVSEGAGPCCLLEFRLLASRAMRQGMTVVLRPLFVVALCYSGPGSKYNSHFPFKILKGGNIFLKERKGTSLMRHSLQRPSGLQHLLGFQEAAPVPPGPPPFPKIDHIGWLGSNI